MLRHIDDAEIRAEIDIALEKTLISGFGGNHSLCHGDLGNLEVIAHASRILGTPRWAVQTQRAAGDIVQTIEREGWSCGIPLAVESPGLMTGLAGIGFGLLRLAEPSAVPSVLMLAPPGGY
jgi:lantibiotic modifying enzyme